MRALRGILILTAFLALTISSRALSPEEARIVHAARSRYYNLQSLGFESATCAVVFDPSALPEYPSPDMEANRRLLKSLLFTVTYNSSTATMSHTYLPSTSSDDQLEAEPLAKVLSSLVTGMLFTWPSKGLEGPIPFDSEIENVAATPEGYRLTLHLPQGPAHLDMDKNYLVTRIVSVGGQIDE